MLRCCYAALRRSTAPTYGTNMNPLLKRRLIVVTGKGGVGKSACTSVIGHHLVRQGRQVALLEVDPRENLHQLLGVPPSGGEIVQVTDGLHLQNLKPRQVADWVVAQQVRIKVLIRRVLKSPIYHRFVEGAPGLKEIAILGHALRLARGDMPGASKIDTVVLDAPATGHGIYLLTAPRLFADTIQEGPFADLAREVADFVADPDACGLVVVTLAEEMPVQEALELRLALSERFGREPELLIANGLYPPLPADADSTGEISDDVRTLWRRRWRLNQQELERLERRWHGPRLDLPLLPIDGGTELVAALGERFDAELSQLGEKG